MRSAWVTIAMLACASNGGGCNSDDGNDGADTDVVDTDVPPPEWTVLGDESNLPAASILSIWMSSDQDVWLVGADDGAGPVVLHYDGTSWSRLDTGTSGDLWWVWSTGGDKVWFSGEGGRILTYVRSTDTWSEEVVTNPGYKMFGIWGTSDTDIWTVGGDVDFGSLDGIILHYDGAAWTESATAPPPTVENNYKRSQAFKVWGAAADDIWVVGTNALLMHGDGVSWTVLEQPVYAGSTLTTVHGSSANWVVAVGGEGNLKAATYDGSIWSDVSPNPIDGDPIVPYTTGVYAPQDGQAVVCGDDGSIWWINGTTWTPDEHAPPSGAWDFHACWVDNAGAVWAVGGDLVNRTSGFIIYGGSAVPPIAL